MARGERARKEGGATYILHVLGSRLDEQLRLAKPRTQEHIVGRPAAKRLASLVQRVGRRRLARQVCRERKDLPVVAGGHQRLEAGHGGCAAGGVAGDDDDVRAALDEVGGERGAEAGGAAGDVAELAGQVEARAEEAHGGEGCGEEDGEDGEEDGQGVGVGCQGCVHLCGEGGGAAHGRR